MPAVPQLWVQDPPVNYDPFLGVHKTDRTDEALCIFCLVTIIVAPLGINKGLTLLAICPQLFGSRYGCMGFPFTAMAGSGEPVA